MNYHKTITLQDGRTCILRNGTAEDGQALLDVFNLTHAQTDFLLTYPEETTHTAQQEADYLARKTQSADEIEILAELDGAVIRYQRNTGVRASAGSSFPWPAKRRGSWARTNCTFRLILQRSHRRRTGRLAVRLRRRSMRDWQQWSPLMSKWNTDYKTF